MATANFKRPEPSKSSQSFEDFDFSKLTTVSTKNSKKPDVGPYSKVRTEKGETRIVMGAEMSALQEENPTVKILIGAAGKVAKIGEDCYLNPNILMGRMEGVLAVG